MTAVDDIGSAGRFGHVEIIYGYGLNTTFCPGVEWSDPPASALEGSSIQLARIDPPVSVVLDEQSLAAVSVNEAEQCATWETGGEWAIHDLDDGDAITLPVSGTPIWLD